MTLREQVSKRLGKARPGWVFTPADFLDVGTPHAVGMVLLRLVRAGKVRRIGRGLYDVPRKHPRLGVLSPRPDAVAQAIARRDGIRIQPAGSTAANLLRMSEQVPARVIYETDGPSRKVKVGNLVMEFQHRRPKRIRNVSPMSGLVFSALRNIGRRHVTSERVAHLRRLLSAADRRQLLKDLLIAPVWMHPHLRFIAGASAPVKRPAGSPSRRTRATEGRK